MMTCLSSLPPLFTNTFLQGSDNKLRNYCERYDNNLTNSDKTHSIGERCNDSSDVGTCIDTSIQREQDIKKIRINNVCKSDINNGHHLHKTCKTRLEKTESGSAMCHLNCQNAQTADFYKADKLSDQSIKRDHGTKRKCDTYERASDYIPLKRISPFLNTPKERKDDRKKILKISVKKIKQLSDPELFLRRTVLVNNTMKRLQSELREDKSKTNRRKPFNFYSVPQNSCFADVYLCHDPFLLGINEEITDNTTDTVINNVLHDKSNDNKKEIASELSDTLCYNVDILENCEF